MDKEYIEEVARKLRATVKEYGERDIKNAALIDSYCHTKEEVCGLEYIYAPTVSGPHLARVNWRVARFFEDI